MKFECIASNLSGALLQVSKARSKSALNPLLQCIYLEVDEYNLIVRATNLEIVCEKTITVKGISNGSCLIHAETLIKVLTLLNKNVDQIICEVTGGVLTLTSGKDILEIKLFGEEDFPKLPARGETKTKIDGKMFTSLVRDVAFCSATTDIKPDIASVFVYVRDNVLYTVATDSYRLAESSTVFECEDFSFLIPQKYTQDILAVIDQEDGELEIAQSDNLVTISNDTLSLSFTLVLGQFPDYKQLFPKEFLTTFSASKDDIQKTLTLSSLFTEQYNTTHLFIEEGSLTVSSKNDQIGSMTKSIQGTKVGENIECFYNNKYFLEVFPHLSGDTVTLSFTSRNRPVFITSNGRNTFTYLLMAVNR